MRLNKEKINKNFKEKIKIKKEIIDSIKKNEWKKKNIYKGEINIKNNNSKNNSNANFLFKPNKNDNNEKK